MRNPLLSLWLSAANSWLGAARGLWTAELQRQQAVLTNEIVRQTTNFWVRTWMAAMTGHEPTRRR